MSEETLDTFSGAPEENVWWVEAVEGLASARQRMGRIAAEKPGKYLLFSDTDPSILVQVETFTRTMIER